MSNKSKSKISKSSNDNDKEEYYHPKLEEQIIVRFPADIAAKLNALMEDEEEIYNDFQIKFTSRHTATIKIFGEELQAMLVSLPTMVESHRTIDGSHLFKSADIGEILIVHRPNFSIEGVLEDFVYDHGLTPPTQSIASKRKIRQDTLRSMQAGGSELDGIKYWEMVEIQLAALQNKDNTHRAIYRREFFEEPNIDPVLLEKVLRRNFGDMYKGFSGKEIDDSEIEGYNNEEPIVKIPQEILNEVNIGKPPQEIGEHEKKEESDNKELDELDLLDKIDEMNSQPENQAETPKEANEQTQSSSSDNEQSSASELTDTLNSLSGSETNEDTSSYSSSSEEEEEEEGIGNEELKRLKTELKREQLILNSKKSSTENIINRIKRSQLKGDNDREVNVLETKKLELEKELEECVRKIEKLQKQIDEYKSSL